MLSGSFREAIKKLAAVTSPLTVLVAEVCDIYFVSSIEVFSKRFKIPDDVGSLARFVYICRKSEDQSVGSVDTRNDNRLEAT